MHCENKKDRDIVRWRVEKQTERKGDRERKGRVTLVYTKSLIYLKHYTPRNEYNRPHRDDKVFVPITMIFYWDGTFRLKGISHGNCHRIASLRLLVPIDRYISVDYILTVIWTYGHRVNTNRHEYCT